MNRDAKSGRRPGPTVANKPLPALAMAEPPPPPRQSSNTQWLVIAIIGGAGCLAMLVVVVGVLAAILLPALSRAREAAQRATCQNNLKQMGLVHKMYAGEHRGKWLELSDTPGVLSFNWNDANPEYLDDANFLICPSSAEPTSTSVITSGETDANYVYLGYVILSDEEAESFAEAYQERLESGGSFGDDLEVAAGEGSGGTDRFYRFAEGVHEEIGAAPAEIPVMFERDTYHRPGGINVLYMDGHVEFIRVPGRFPATPNMLELIEELEAAGG